MNLFSVFSDFGKTVKNRFYLTLYKINFFIFILQDLEQNLFSTLLKPATFKWILSEFAKRTMSFQDKSASGMEWKRGSLSSVFELQ